MSTTLEAGSGKVVAVATEIASSKWVVASFAGERVRRKVLSAEDAQGRFEALLSEVREVRRRWEVAEGDRVVVGYEAGQQGFWLVRALRSRGVEAEVIDPASLPVERRARRAKTDRLDADALVRLQPGNEITRWYQARTEGSGARGRRVMIVAVARKLAIALWRYVTTGEIPAGARLKAVAA